MENKAGACIIDARVPLETLFGYVTDIRSSQGPRVGLDHPSHFEQVPNSPSPRSSKPTPRGPPHLQTLVLFKS